MGFLFNLNIVFKQNSVLKSVVRSNDDCPLHDISIALVHNLRHLYVSPFLHIILIQLSVLRLISLHSACMCVMLMLNFFVILYWCMQYAYACISRWKGERYDKQLRREEKYISTTRVTQLRILDEQSHNSLTFTVNIYFVVQSKLCAWIFEAMKKVCN